LHQAGVLIYHCMMHGNMKLKKKVELLGYQEGLYCIDFFNITTWHHFL